jgi:CubicO group peptidase (beta-lactamase class C family)
MIENSVDRTRLRDGAGKEVVGYYHTGSLGQWVVVYPKTKTVGVRLRRRATAVEKPEYEFGGVASRLAAAR